MMAPFNAWRALRYEVSSGCWPNPSPNPNPSYYYVLYLDGHVEQRQSEQAKGVAELGCLLGPYQGDARPLDLGKHQRQPHPLLLERLVRVKVRDRVGARFANPNP